MHGKQAYFKANAMRGTIHQTIQSLAQDENGEIPLDQLIEKLRSRQ